MIARLAAKFGGWNRGLSPTKLPLPNFAGSSGASVSSDRPTGENATSATPSARQACSSPSSTKREESEYSDCTAATGNTAWARRSDEGWRKYDAPDRPGDPDILAHRDHVHVDVFT